MYFSIKKIKKDGTKLDIRVSMIDGKFRINDIGVKPKGKRKFTYAGNSISNNYSYRSLNREDKLKFELNIFISICPVELLNEALQDAWMSIKPEEITI